jgi:glycosyltransferase A (GT-A) superfamily protein (DUF2064 family)
LLGARGAAELQAALTADVIRKVERLSAPVACWFFLAGGSFPALLSRRHWRCERQHGSGLGGSLASAFRSLLRYHSAAAVIGTDSPLLPPRRLRQALDELRVCDAVLGPCPDGGFYLIGLRRHFPGLFRDVRWGTASAFRDMLRNLLGRGLACSVLEPIPDLDRPEDYLHLARHMAQNPATRRLAPATWKFLKRLRRVHKAW